jgi:EAL domain-containing protein (putative c-di-GMP-specific phosphodiesterase class I)
VEEIPTEEERSAARAVLDLRALKVAFQPIVEFSSGTVFAYEALVRPDIDAVRSPPTLFRAAVQERLCGPLGRIIRELAVEGCPDTPLFLNIHPEEFGDRYLVRPDDPLFEHSPGVYLEITESVPLSHYEMCHSVLTELRHRGICLAVDDLGAGFSNLKYIADLSPEIVKLDRQLIVALHEAPRLRKLVRSLIRLCEDLGAKVVAEGIETPEEYAALRDLGTHYAQGYFVARPAFEPPSVSEALRAL